MSWFSIFRLGIVQLCIGSIVVLPLSTFNRLMVIELALPALLPGFLIALHYGVQITRPSWGYLSDLQKDRSKWIKRGMIILGLGGIIAALSIPVFKISFGFGLLVSFFAYTLIGLGVGATGTPLLALLAAHTSPERKAAAASITFLMMIFGLAFTAIAVGRLLDPYSNQKLITIVASIAILANLLTFLSIYGLEKKLGLGNSLPAKKIIENIKVFDGIKQIWTEPEARTFTFFVFLAMTAFFMQEVILEPFAGTVFNLTPGESTALSGMKDGGSIIGIIFVVLCVSFFRLGSEKFWLFAGCLVSAASLYIMTALGISYADVGLLKISVLTLGIANGIFTAGILGTMMKLASNGNTLDREGTRMGLWGASQAYAAGIAALISTSLVDFLRLIIGDPALSYGLVFSTQGLLFILSAFFGIYVVNRSQKTNSILPMVN
jgi:BCD family chlorophyll transporter-like MFS transporter